MMNLLDLTILGPAMIAGIIVAVTHVPLGRQVLVRGIIFLDLAVAQIAGLGATAASVFFHEPSMLIVQVSTFTGALVGSFLLYQMEQRWAEIQEALIGSIFVIAASLNILLLAHDPHGGEQLQSLLAGQILWVGSEQLAIAGLMSLVVLLIWNFARKKIGGVLFYLAFSLAVTTSVQLVGVYLVFASLILPALASRHTSLVWGFAVALSGYGVGLVGSALFDTPAGPMIVLSIAFCSFIPFLLSGNKLLAVKKPEGTGN